MQRNAGAGEDRLRPYVAFHAALRGSFTAFVAALEAKGRDHLAHHLAAASAQSSEVPPPWHTRKQNLPQHRLLSQHRLNRPDQPMCANGAQNTANEDTTHH